VDGQEGAMPGTARTVPLFGLDVRAETLPEAVAAVDAVVQARRPTLHVVLNALKASEISDDPAMRDLLRSFDMIHADGTSIVWASRILGRPLPERVAGIDLFVALLELAAKRGYRPYLLGARREVVEEVARRVEEQYAGLRLAGWRDGYWDANDPAAEAAVVAAIRDARPDLLFVAMPTPRKELFLARYKDAMGVPFSMGVGGSFDVLAGKVTRAPRWMQRAGLEWFHRFLQEPRKMWKRYLVTNSHFAWLLVKERCRRLSRGD
jgi:N-acetylglucosaminyldiphosphoundecaprenol N-acetyl-beta-D-mannosaminyltransferase